MSYSPRLKITSSGKEFKLLPDFNLIGSTQALGHNAIFLNDESVDGKHALFKFDRIAQTTQILDLISKKGTDVDGDLLPPLTWRSLENQQKICFGYVEALFLTDDSSAIFVPETQRCTEEEREESQELDHVSLPETQFSRTNSFSDLDKIDEELDKKIASVSEDAFAPKCKDEFFVIVPETPEKPGRSDEQTSSDNIILPETQAPADNEIFDIPDGVVRLEKNPGWIFEESQNLLTGTQEPVMKASFNLQNLKSTRSTPVEISKKLVTNEEDDDTDCEEELAQLERSAEKSPVSQTREASITPEMEELHQTEKTEKTVIFRRPESPPGQPVAKKARVYEMETQMMNLKSFYDVETQRDDSDSDMTQKFSLREFHGENIYCAETQAHSLDSSQSSQLSTPPCTIELPKALRGEDLHKMLQKRQMEKKSTGLNLAEEESDEDDFVFEDCKSEFSRPKTPMKAPSAAQSKRLQRLRLIDSESEEQAVFIPVKEPEAKGKAPIKEPPGEPLRRSNRTRKKISLPDYDCDTDEENISRPRRAKAKKLR